MNSRRVVIACLLILSLVSCQILPAATPAPTAVPPTDTPAATPTETPAPPTETHAPDVPLGSISGNIVPPDKDKPQGALRVYARETKTGKVYSLEVPQGQASYSVTGLPPGVYVVIGWFYPQGVSGAYTSVGKKIVSARTSADQMKCNLSLVEVELVPGDMDFQGADIACWAGDFFFLLTPAP